MVGVFGKIEGVGKISSRGQVHSGCKYDGKRGSGMHDSCGEG